MTNSLVRQPGPPVGADPAPSPVAGTAPALPKMTPDLGDEVEAFLAGRLVDHLVALDRPVPAWTVLNAVAHGTVAELASLASLYSDDPVVEAGVPRWMREQRALAAQLLEVARTPPGAAEVQRRLLVPLELWFAAQAQTTTVTWRRVAEMAADALDGLRPGR